MATYNTEKSINAYYEGMKAPVNAEIDNAKANYDNAIRRLEENKADADAAAYRNLRRQQVEMPGILRANGSNGGMVDSSVASLNNNYLKNKAGRVTALQGNIANETLGYNEKLNNLRAQLTKYEQQANADKYELHNKKL
mgnify:CR=1 FL=1